MRRLLCWILATVLAILLGAAYPSAAAQIEIWPGPGYTYDGHGHVAVPTYTTTERGPPAAPDQGTIYDAVGRWPRGASARPGTAPSGSTTTYTTRSALAHVPKASATTSEQARLLGGAASSVTASDLAAKGAPAAERLFTSRTVGVDSKLLGNSYARGESGLLNRKGAVGRSLA